MKLLFLFSQNSRICNDYNCYFYSHINIISFILCLFNQKCDSGNKEGWTNDDSLSCNDGIACTRNDHCFSGTCIGTPFTCLYCEECYNDACRVKPGYCTIAVGNASATCFSHGDLRPGFPCQVRNTEADHLNPRRPCCCMISQPVHSVLQSPFHLIAFYLLFHCPLDLTESLRNKVAFCPSKLQRPNFLFKETRTLLGEVISLFVLKALTLVGFLVGLSEQFHKCKFVLATNFGQG